MLPEAPPEIAVAMDMGISLFLGETEEGRLAEVIWEVRRAYQSITGSTGLQGQRASPLLKFPALLSADEPVFKITHVYRSGGQWQRVFRQRCRQEDEITVPGGCIGRLHVDHAVAHYVADHQGGPLQKGLVNGFAALNFCIRYRWAPETAILAE